MASIEIRRLDGDEETRTLSKTQPVSIGRHSTCDVRIEEDDVATLHCRISWNRTAYEITSGHTGGVEVNGRLVRHHTLSDGDLIRVGSVDLVAVIEADRTGSSVRRSPAAAQPVPEIEFEEAPAPRGATRPAPREKSEEIGLAPITEDLPIWKQRGPEPIADRLLAEKERSEKERADREQEAREREARERESKHRPAPEAPGVYRITTPETPPANRPADRSQKVEIAPPRKVPPRPIEVEPEPEELDNPSIVDEEEIEALPTAEVVLPRNGRWDRGAQDDFAAPAPARAASATAPPRNDDLSPLSRRPRRPGERDPIRSPLVLGMAGGTLALALAGATVWFMIHRSSIQKEFDAGLDDLNQGRYAQAIERFDAFIVNHPRHHYTPQARLGLGRARIEREISGSSGAWQRGLDAVNEFIDVHRDDTNFSDLQPEIVGYAERIALGAARSAETARKKEPLSVTADAGKLLARYIPADQDLNARQRRIAAAVAAAESAIGRQDAVNATVASIEKSLGAKQALEAFATRRKLLDRYPDADAGKLKQLQQRTLDIEKENIVREEGDRDAERNDRPATTPAPFILAPHPRSRTDQVSDGRTVFVVAKDCCFGIDAVTGNPVWRRVIGLDAPFFPIVVNTSIEGLLLFDARRSELQLVERRTGRLVWRQTLESNASGAPAIHEGQAYLATADGALTKIDLETGRITSKLKFSQRLVGPPALVAKDSRLVIPGAAEVLYTLTLRPLACEAVTFLGHRPGTIEAPVMPLGSLLLVCENDRQASARLRALDTSGDGTWLAELASERVEGQVRDRPAIRGNELFVPGGDERLALFIASDVKGTKPLSPTVRYQAPTARPGPMFLSLGADGQVWLAGNMLRKLQRKPDSVAVEGPLLAEGLSTQPLQLIGDRLYMGRRQPFSTAVLFTQTDRKEMTSSWRTVVGATPLAVMSTGDAIVTVTEQGDVFRIGSRDLADGGFRLESQAQLKLPEKLEGPLKAWRMGDDRIAVTAGGSEPMLWIVNGSAQVEREVKLEAPLEASPVQLAAGLVLPLPKRLKMLPSGGGKVDDFLATIGKDETVEWKHVARIDESQVLAVDSRGRLSRIQYRAMPVAALAEVAHIDLPQPLDVAPAVEKERFFLADAARRLQRVDVGTLETASNSELKDAASQAVWKVGETLFVETARNQLNAFKADGLQLMWTAKLVAPLAGPPALAEGLVVIACQDGAILGLSPTNGDVAKQFDLGQPLVAGPQAVGGVVVVPSIDGSWHRIEEKLR